MAKRAHIKPSSTKAILDDFDKRRELYTSFTSAVYEIITKLTHAGGMRVHEISHRTKSRESLIEKLNHHEKSYQSLNEITDISGVRVICYLSDEVNVISSLIEKEFSVDYARSIDKRQSHAPQSFGYMSVHYICGLNANRLALSEYKSFGGLTVEVQIRSILQHAWAEIEHDLGYKSSAVVPLETQRQFSRIASLLETADNEFAQIRSKSHPDSKVGRYDSETAAITTKSRIDTNSLMRYYLFNSNAIACESEMSHYTGLPCLTQDEKTALLERRPEPGEFEANVIEGLLYMHIDNFEELDRALIDNIHAIARFTPVFIKYIGRWDTLHQSEYISPGWPLMVLPYALILESPEPAIVRQSKLYNFFVYASSKQRRRNFFCDLPLSPQELRDFESEWRSDVEKEAWRCHDDMMRAYRDPKY